MTSQTPQNLEATVVHIEDDRMIRDLVKDFLEMKGIRVVSMEDLQT